MATSFEAGIASALAVVKGVLSLTPGPLNPDLDIWFNCNGYDRFGNANQGVPVAHASVEGSKAGIDVVAGAIAYAEASGAFNAGNAFEGDSIAYASASGDLLLEGDRSNFAKWSRIDDKSFDITKQNIAGERPLDWKGSIHNIRKLGGTVVYAGDNGVSILTPAGSGFGLNTINKTGLLGRDAFAGTDFFIYFADKLGRLFRLSSGGMEELDYREFLITLTNPVFSWDDSNKILYMCDGTNGYQYSPDSRSFGKGPPNVTAIEYQSGSLYVGSPEEIATPDFKIWSSTYDFGSRKSKDIHFLEIGVDMTEQLEAAVRYRNHKGLSFTQTGWYIVDRRGVSFITCTGHEFQFGFRVGTENDYEYFEPDYINVEVTINAY